MNIGEIKKPSVDGQLVKSHKQMITIAPIEILKSIGDHVDISVRAKERFNQYKKKQKKTPENPQNESTQDDTEPKSHIDVIA